MAVTGDHSVALNAQMLKLAFGLKPRPLHPAIAPAKVALSLSIRGNSMGVATSGGRWAAVGGALSVLITGVGFAADIGGLRETVCSPDLLQDFCLRHHLIAPPPPPPMNGERVDEYVLINTIAGEWGRPGCKKTFKYVVKPQSDGSTALISVNDGFTSEGRVVGVTRGVVISQTMIPKDKAGPRWEFRPEPFRMTVTDAHGIATELVRCG